MMKRVHLIYCIVAFAAIAVFSCSDEEKPEIISETYELSFDVLATAETGNGEETEFRSLYIYAYDIDDGTVDYYKVTDINKVQNRYSVRMNITKEGEKRFYVIANPPAYIADQLVETCSEINLQDLVLVMKSVIYNMDELPQHQDGVETGANTGFPMSNYMTAYAGLDDKTDHKMTLYADAENKLIITSLPVIRCLGKVTIKAYLYEHNTSVSIEKLNIYHFTGDGSFLPIWKKSDGTNIISDWKESATLYGYAEWNSTKELDLAALEEKEMQLITSTLSILPKRIEVNNTYKDKTTAIDVASFYICQNSYGNAANTGEQPGIEDIDGNRTTRLAVSLSDGRSNEMSLPYLRRNDHLTVYLKITAYTVQLEFKVWNLANVTPEWHEE